MINLLNLNNVDGHVNLQLDIDGPVPPNSAWCRVKALVKQGNSIFEAVDPALEINDLHNIHDWLEKLSNNRLPSYARLDFTEPCLAFEFLACRENSVRISIHLSHELRPDFALTQLGFTLNEWQVVFELKPHDFDLILCNIAIAIAICKTQ